MSALRERLERIVGNGETHGLLMAKLACLEKSGHRKLIKLQNRLCARDQCIIAHAADEARHAHLLDRASKELGVRGAMDGHTRTYVTRLELFALRKLREEALPTSPLAPYVLVSYTLEERAKELYPCYELVLRSSSSAFSVQSIIDDELLHLDGMEKALSSLLIPYPVIQACLEFERSLFATLLEGLGS
jgi:hypothetical protein